MFRLDHEGLGFLLGLFLLLVFAFLVVLFALFVFLVVFLGLLGFVFLGFLVGFLDFLHQFVLFFSEEEFVVGVLVHESDEHVVLAAPGGVGAHTVAVGDIDNGVAVEGPLGAVVDIGALGDVVGLA